MPVIIALYSPLSSTNLRVGTSSCHDFYAKGWNDRGRRNRDAFIPKYLSYFVLTYHNWSVIVLLKFLVSINKKLRKPLIIYMEIFFYSHFEFISQHFCSPRQYICSRSQHFWKFLNMKKKENFNNIFIDTFIGESVCKAKKFFVYS